LTFSLKKTADGLASAGTLHRVVQQILEGYALHSVEFDTVEHGAFRLEIREIAGRFDRCQTDEELLILTGEANKTIRNYNHLAEKFIQELSAEKQQTVKLLTQALLRVCRASEKSAQPIRQVESELALASQLQKLRDLRAKLAECVSALCLEADVQEARFLELQEQMAQSSALLASRDQVTGLRTTGNANQRIRELSSSGSQGYVMAFFLKNLDVINRRFGFAAGDDILRRFSAYLTKNLHEGDQLFRWRGPCFVMVTDRSEPLEAIESEAKQLGLRGPEQEVENNGKSMLIRLTAATAAFAIPKGRENSELPSKIDQFAAEQYKMVSAAVR
jgi:GGDEF domain-containing protein